MIEIYKQGILIKRYKTVIAFKMLYPLSKQHKKDITTILKIFGYCKGIDINPNLRIFYFKKLIKNGGVK